MLSFLLQAAVLHANQAVVGAPDQPSMLCPPCHPEETPATILDFTLSLIRSIMSVLVIVYPLYKTFKAWESNRLTACRQMLAYWSAMTLLNVIQSISEELIGNYISSTISKMFCLAVKVMPMILGPERIYNLTLRTFFEQHEEQFDMLVTQAHQSKQSMLESTKPVMDSINQSMHETLSPVINSMNETLSPVIKSINQSFHSSVKDDTVKPLNAKEAYQKDQVFESASMESSGLKQRRKRASDNLSSANQSNNQSNNQTSAKEIEDARAHDVLTEKIVWGHGLMAKNEEAHRQQSDNQSSKQSINQSIKQSIDQDMEQAKSPYVDQSIHQSKIKVKLPVAAPVSTSTTGRSINPSLKQSENQTINQSNQLISPVHEPPYIVFHGENDKVDPNLIHQSTKSSINQSINQSNNESNKEPISQSSSFQTIPLDSVKTIDQSMRPHNQSILESRKEW